MTQAEWVIAHNKHVLRNKWNDRLREYFALACLEDWDFISFIQHMLIRARRQSSITNWTIQEEGRSVKIWIEAFKDCEFTFDFHNVPRPEPKNNWKEGF